MNMIARNLVVAAFAATVAAGPCKPTSLPSDIFSISSESTIEPTTTIKSEVGSSTTTFYEQSTKTTEEASTTTTSGTASEGIILQVNPQRRLAKRDITFVGNDNPTSCTFATAFHIDAEQLLQDGVPIYYKGEGYQELAAQGTPPAGAITKAFSITGGYLSWTNPAFGEAGFCQTPSEGKVYITFGSKPEGCQRVTITAYKESQCQDGHIIDLESSSAEATSTAESTSETTEETVSAETTSHSAEVTSSVDACVAGIRNANGQPDLQSRLHDCSVYNTVTVSPIASTATVVKRRVLYQIPTAWATPQPMIRRRADDPTDTTISPTSIPPYATYCDSPSEYYEACSEAGVTAFTTTLPEPDTTTTTSTSDGCGPKSKFKRAVEYLGYTMSEDWDRAIFTGIALHERFHD